MLIIGIHEPEIVVRDSTQFYCNLSRNLGVYVVTTFSVIYAIVALVSEWNTGKLEAPT